jgi:hypothetical protein
MSETRLVQHGQYTGRYQHTAHTTRMYMNCFARHSSRKSIYGYRALNSLWSKKFPQRYLVNKIEVNK